MSEVVRGPEARPGMARDMTEQPGVVERLVGRRPSLRSAFAALRNRGFAGVLLVARGSSDNAAIYGRYVLEMVLGRPVALSANSLFTRYGCRTDLTGWLVIAVSQSGSTPEVVEVVERSAQLGAKTIAVTNAEDAPLAAAAQRVVELGAGLERAVPATKTYTATLVAFALLAEVLGEVPWTDRDLEALPEALTGVLESSATGCERATDALATGRPSVHLGRGLLYGTALESALKMREAAALPVTGYSTSDFLHGPIAASTSETIAVCHVGADVTRNDGLDTIEALVARGSTALAVGAADVPGATWGTMPVPPVHPALAPVLHAVRGQQLALAVALARGTDPDAPAGLTKVTPTA